MSTRFVMFKMASPDAEGNRQSILINPAHVRTAHQSGSDQVTLVMDHGRGGGHENVEGNIKSVWGEAHRATGGRPRMRLKGTPKRIRDPDIERRRYHWN